MFSGLNPRELAKADAILRGEYLPLDRFAQRAWGIIDPGVPLKWNWHHDRVCAHLEAVTLLLFRNLIVNIPPRCTKSRLVSVMWPAWAWTFLPHTRWLFSSYAGERAVQDAIETRRILGSPWYQGHWGHRFQLTGDQNVKSRYQNDRGGLRVSTGVRGKGLGEGGDFIVTDDPHKREDVFSKGVRTATNEWWTRTMGTRDNDPTTTGRVIILQRLHEEDIVGHVTEREERGGRKYVRLVFPMEWEGDDVPSPLGPKQDPRTTFGELLHPDRFTPETVTALKVSLGSYGYGSQCQQNPGPLIGNIFKKTNWGYWQRPGDNFPPVQVRDEENELVTCPLCTLPDTFDALGQSWDATFKETEKGSFVAGEVWGRKAANRYLVDLRRGRVDIIQTMQWMLDFRVIYPRARLILIEDKANGPAIITMLKNRVGGIVPYSPRGSKVARATAFKPDQEAGNLWLPHPRIAPWVDALVERFAAFPAGADDEVDCMSQLLDHWTEDEEEQNQTQSQALRRDALVAVLGG